MITLRKKLLPVIATTVIAYLALLLGCKKDKNTPANADNNNRLGYVISDNFNLSLFNTGLNYTGLYPLLNSGQRLTILAPDDPSFNAAGYADATAVTSANKAQLAAVLRYHILAGKYDFNTLPFLFNQEVKTIDGLSMYVTRWVKDADTVLTINGTQIVSKNLAGSNGLIQVINSVLTPSTYPLLSQAIAGNDSLTFFNQALIRANLADMLQQAGPYTVFAPTNGAFKAAGYPSLESINSADPSTLAALLKYQMLSGRKFVYDYVLGTDASNTSKQTMLDGNNVTINLLQNGIQQYTGITLRGIGNTTQATLLKQNVLTGNGVLHIITQVLKPNI